MCRLAAFPPHFARDKAIDILRNFEKCNQDGVGSAHVENGKFIIYKTPRSLTRLLRSPSEKEFLAHMPHNGWTIAHLRAASHGANRMRNTHPFIVGDWAFAHNGIWFEYNLIKTTFAGLRKARFKGETDSEVAGHFLKTVGPKRFTDHIDTSGVFLALNKDGCLHVMRTSGDLEFQTREDGAMILASELDSTTYPDAFKMPGGWHKFSPDGTLKYRRFKYVPEPQQVTVEREIDLSELSHEELSKLSDEELIELQEELEEDWAENGIPGRNEFRELNLRELTRAELEQSIPARPPYLPQSNSPFYHGFD